MDPALTSVAWRGGVYACQGQVTVRSRVTSLARTLLSLPGSPGGALLQKGTSRPTVPPTQGDPRGQAAVPAGDPSLTHSPPPP